MTDDARTGPNSRYAGLAQATHLAADGTPCPYLTRRFLPREAPPALARVTVVQGDRPDLLAARHLGDPEAWWRLADANTVLHPAELCESPGGTVVIGLPGAGGGGGT